VKRIDKNKKIKSKEFQHAGKLNKKQARQQRSQNISQNTQRLLSKD